MKATLKLNILLCFFSASIFANTNFVDNQIKAIKKQRELILSQDFSRDSETCHFFVSSYAVSIRNLKRTVVNLHTISMKPGGSAKEKLEAIDSNVEMISALDTCGQTQVEYEKFELMRLVNQYDEVLSSQSSEKREILNCTNGMRHIEKERAKAIKRAYSLGEDGYELKELNLIPEFCKIK